MVLMSVVAAKDMVLYSASVEDFETVSCHLADHEMMFEPRNVQNPPVDFLVL